ncbi:helix-turn-helix domain-containing protein [Sporosarcina obsidiansis]
MYLELGYSIRAIAKLTGRHPSKLSRELARQTKYNAESAQHQYEAHKSWHKVKIHP